MLRTASDRWPDVPAVAIDNKRSTYAELSDAALRFAAGLGRQGVKPGDHVALCLGNSVEWIIAFYGIALLGAVTVPVNTRFKADELAYCLRQSDARALVIADRFLNIDFMAMLREICPDIDAGLPVKELPLLTMLIVLGTDVPNGALHFDDLLTEAVIAGNPPKILPEDILLIQYTSGTTSFPKGVMLSHDSMLRDATHVAERLGLRSGDRYFSARPFFHVAGTTLSILASLCAGASLYSVPFFDPLNCMQIMQNEGCDIVGANDTMFLMMINHPDFAKFKFSPRAGWAAAGPEVMRQVHERFPVPNLCWGYGLSEASPNVAINHWNDPIDDQMSGRAEPLPGILIRIVDPQTDRELPDGRSGEIQLRGWCVMKGYYKMPEQTAAAIDTDGWLRTGDLGLAQNGRLTFVGRLKDVFRVGGENVSPAEVEEVLQAHPKVKQAQVIGVPDARLVEVPAAYVVAKPGELITPAEMISWCKQRSASFRVPHYVRIVEGFEDIGMTSSAKIQKNKLRQQALIDFSLPENFL
jgi:fatty-acyl-CoA synthase